FELSNLVHLRRVLGSRARQVLLVTAQDETPWDLAHPAGPWPAAPELCPSGRTYGDLLSPAGLAALRGVVEGLGPDKEMVLPWSADGTLGAGTRLVADAHAAGMVVHPWTFRA